MKRTLVSLFDGTARVIYKIERSRPLKYGLILTVLAALLVLALARPMYNEDTKVYAYALKDISSTSVGRLI